jgi:methionine aminotransferase
VNSISQIAISEYLDIVNVNDLGNFYQQKRDFFRNILRESKLELLPCEGTYFQVADYSKISDEDDVSFTKRLLTEYGVATIPISTFYENKKDTQCIRFCFAKDDTTLLQAADRLMKL